jgi:hypothetical protein
MVVSYEVNKQIKNLLIKRFQFFNLFHLIIILKSFIKNEICLMRQKHYIRMFRLKLFFYLYQKVDFF